MVSIIVVGGKRDIILPWGCIFINWNSPLSGIWEGEASSYFKFNYIATQPKTQQLQLETLF